MQMSLAQNIFRIAAGPPLNLRDKPCYFSGIALCCLVLLGALQPAPGQMPPQIVVQPQDQYACAGSAATFHVQAIGDAPLAFFWFHNFTQLTSGVVSTPNSSSLTFSNVATTDNATLFFAVVTNQFGFQMSSNAFLYVPTPQITQITQDPFDQSVALGATATFHVQASPAPLAYSWWFQGAPLSDSAHINGSTTDTLTIFNAQLGDAGYYRAEVTNTCLVVDSLPARCDVGNPPVITNQPVNVLAPFQTNIQFRVGASGAGLSYPARKQFNPEPGGGSSASSRDLSCGGLWPDGRSHQRPGALANPTDLRILHPAEAAGDGFSQQPHECTARVLAAAHGSLSRRAAAVQHLRCDS
jgi:hypothetical protein